MSFLDGIVRTQTVKSREAVISSPASAIWKGGGRNQYVFEEFKNQRWKSKLGSGMQILLLDFLSQNKGQINL